MMLEFMKKYGLICRSCSPHLRSSSKQETDVLEITTFLPASDSLFGPRLIFKQSYLTWSDYILNLNEMATEKLEIRCVNNLR